MAEAVTASRPTVRILHLPQTTTALDLLTFLESHFGPGSVSAVDIPTDRRNWKPRPFARVLFSSLGLASAALSLGALTFGSRRIVFSSSFDDVLPVPHDPRHRVDRGCSLVAGFVFSSDVVCELGRWDVVRGWVMPDRSRVEFWVEEKGSGCFEYKLEVKFEDVIECVGCHLEESDRVNAVVIKFKYGPRIYKRVSGPQVVSKFRTDRYHIYNEDFNFLWVRTTDFTATMAIGQSNCFVWKIDGEVSTYDVFGSLPFYKEEAFSLSVEEGDDFYSRYHIVPLLESISCPKLDYEVFFQLNSLVHTQKISLAAAYALADSLNAVDVDSAILVLEKLHKLKTTCYEPVPFVKAQLHVLKTDAKHVPSSYVKRLTDGDGMYCHRALITPTKIYCLGPELETSNYVVKNFKEHASDFLRVTFVEEDWSKIPINAISTSTQSGLFSKPFRTEIYHRILNVLRDGIVIGDKRFQFLAFSASQLRSSSVWMFASNEKVTAEQVREWMGCFKNIRSISKCAARMGQLFSSSVQTHVVPTQDVEIIPDIEINTDGVDYCFSDGIGKISLPFARQVAQKCGLSHTPSAFQIRYGGYKGVIAVDRRSFRKLSLRDSMMKFESSNKMLNVTKWSEAMPCYLNREVIILLSTLGVKDEVFEAMQHEQLVLLGKMLTDTEAALSVLDSLSGTDKRNILVKMLQMGYKPNEEAFLQMMLGMHHLTQVAELKSRCRIHVPKGRVLLGCLDEAGILNYGQVYVRITLTKSELEYRQQKFFHKIDETTSALIGKVIVTKNPCLYPGDIRVLKAVYDAKLEEMGLVDCVVFPQKGERPHPNECSGGDLDGDLYFVSWEADLIPPKSEPPMDYTARRPRIMDHEVTLEEIHGFFVDYMINDTLGAISTAHLVHADREPDKGRSENCLQLATLHSMAVDFAKTGAPAEMPNFLKPREFPDFMERTEKTMYVSTGALGKLYRATVDTSPTRCKFIWSRDIAEQYYDPELVVDGFGPHLKTAETHREAYAEKLGALMLYYGADSEDEILTGNLQKKASYLQRDNRRYGDMKDRISLSIKRLQKEAKGWFDSSCCEENEHRALASAWYHVTYHPDFVHEGTNFLSFPWIVGDVLLGIKSENRRRRSD